MFLFPYVILKSFLSHNFILMNQDTAVTVMVTIHASKEKVWEYFTNPKHIVNWYFAADTWHAPMATNNLAVNGTFKTTMAAKDGSAQFDFEGFYTKIIPNERIEYELADKRKVEVKFEDAENGCVLTQTIEPEQLNSIELQESGWAAILINLKKYIENQ